MSIEQKAREIAAKASGYETIADATDGVDAYSFSDMSEAARLGIIEGLEMAAKVAEGVDLFEGDILKNSDPRVTIAAAIRALIEEP